MLAEKITWMGEPDYTHWKPGCEQFISWEYQLYGSGEIHTMRDAQHATYEVEKEILIALKNPQLDKEKLKDLITKYGKTRYFEGQDDLREEWFDNRR